MTDKNPLVTVATVCFNPVKQGRKQAFQVCIDSIRTQSYPNIEHLIIDGASDDGSVDFIKKNAETNERIRFISENGPELLRKLWMLVEDIGWQLVELE